MSKKVYVWVSWNVQICPFAGPKMANVLKRKHAAASFVALYGSFLGSESTRVSFSIDLKTILWSLGLAQEA